MKRHRNTYMVLALSLWGMTFFGPQATGHVDHATEAVHQTREARATFAGGCFWCMEPPFDKLDGVLASISGYSGGHVENPSYNAVSAGGTGHIEVVQVRYDPDKISYQDLLAVYWVNIDPTTRDQQFCDKGSQYRSAIFTHDADQHRQAQQSLQALQETKPFPEEIVTELLPFKNFYAAEDYHQDYYLKNPIRYKFYRYSCGRDKRLRSIWGDQ